MSLATCKSCEVIIDTDYDPDACVGDDFLCELCREDWGCGITQEEIDSNNGVNRDN